MRNDALRNFESPTPGEIVTLLNSDAVVTVKGIRKLIVDELRIYQREISGGEFDLASNFYDAGRHRSENSCTKIIVDRLRFRLSMRDVGVVVEHQLKNLKRSDFTVSRMLKGNRRLLVTEAKGRWHRDLFSAAKEQLHERYAIHPDQLIRASSWTFGSAGKLRWQGRLITDTNLLKTWKTRFEPTFLMNYAGLSIPVVLDVSIPGASQAK